MQRSLATLALAVSIAGLLPTDVFAHAVGVDCTLRLGKLEIEVFYDDDSPAQKAKVQLVNSKDEVIASAITDECGRCAFRKPAQGKYEVRVDAGAGHRTMKKIDVPASTPQEAIIGVALNASFHVAEAAPTSSQEATGIRDSPTRAEFTRFPWERVLIGFAVIGGLGGAFLLGSMMRKSQPPK